MALTKLTDGVRGTITNAQISDLPTSKLTGTVADSQIVGMASSKLTGTLSDSQIAAMAASKLTGALPAIDGSNLTGVASDISNLNANVALNFFLDAIDHARSVQNFQDGWTDQFEDQTGVDDNNSLNETYDSSNDLYKPTPGATVPMVVFDGSNDFLGITEGTLGAADSKFVLISFWIKFIAGNGDQIRIMDGNGGKTAIVRFTDNKMEFRFRSVAGGDVWATYTDATFLAGTLYHFLVAMDSVNQETDIYVNGSVAAFTDVTAVVSNTDVDWTNGAVNLMAKSNGTFVVNAEIGQFYLSTEYLDITVEANRRKFISAAGLVVDLGSDGSTPTGTAPLIFLNNTTSTWQNNLGSGGNFTETGALTDGTDLTGSTENMTLMAEPVVALAAPAKAHVTLFKQDVDAVTLNTHLLAWVSRSKQTVTSDFGTDEKLDATAHGLVNTDRVIVTSSAGDVPAGLSQDVVYFVVNKTTNDFEVSLSSGGSAVNITDNGTGTHSVHAVTAVTLVDEGTYSSYDIIAGAVDISAQPSDTDMVLFVQSKNTKNMKIHGQSLQWED